MTTWRQLVNWFVTTCSFSRVFSRVCKLLQICKQVATRLLSSWYQDVFACLSGCFWMTITDLLQVIPTRLTQAVATSLIVAINLLTTCYCTCRRYQTCWDDLLRICWPHQPACYKVITTCFRLANNYEHTVRIHRVGRLWHFNACTLTKTGFFVIARGIARRLHFLVFSSTGTRISFILKYAAALMKQ